MAVHDAVVVGSGSAGLSAARTLDAAGADYLVVTESLGGRIAYSPEEKVNFGAYFVMANYHNAKKLVIRETWINPLSCRFHDGHGSSFPTLSSHTLRLAPALVRFAALMARFVRHYKRYKRDCEQMSQREAMERDPWIGRLFTQSASQLIAQHRLETVAEDMISKFSYACTGVSLDRITALDFLNVSQGLVLPIHRFQFDAQAERARLGEHLVEDRVVSVALVAGIHQVTCSNGTIVQARNLILATPASVTAQLLGLGEIRETCQLYVEHVVGSPRPHLADKQMNLFPFSSPVIFTAVQDDGSYLVYSREPEIDLDALFSTYEVVGRRDWAKAMYVSGRAYVEQQYGDTTYVAGDHNGLGLEPTAISGIYAARQVLKSLTR